MASTDLSLGVKRLEREAEHSPSSTAGFKNALSYTSTPPYGFTTWHFVKPRHNFTISFIGGGGVFHE